MFLCIHCLYHVVVNLMFGFDMVEVLDYEVEIQTESED